MEPRIETRRLSLRLPEMRDAPDLSRYAGDYDIAKMTSRIPSPYPVLAAETWVLQTRAAWAPGRNISLTVEHEGDLAGGGGIFKRGPEADWEIGYWLAKPFWGRGFGTELGAGLMQYARKQLGADRIVAGHFQDNPASGRILEKLGFVYTGEAPRLFSMARMGRAPCRSMTWDEATGAAKLQTCAEMAI